MPLDDENKILANRLMWAWDQAKNAARSTGLVGQGGPIPKHVPQMEGETGLDYAQRLITQPTSEDNPAFGFAGTFAGVGAKTANLSALRAAEALERSGAPIDDIWRATGWGRGVDGKWRFEIDDTAASIRPKTDEVNMKKRQFLGKSLVHDDIFSAYPDAADIKYIPDYAGYASGRKGFHSAENNEIGVNVFGGGGNRALRSAAKEQQRSTTLHELQHAIQSREGFAGGASADEFVSGPMFDKRATDLAGDMSQYLTGGVSARPVEIIDNLKYGDRSQLSEIAKKHGFDSLDSAVDFLRMQDEMRTPFGQYRRFAGEVEARNVQNRLGMSEDQRRMTPPWKTEDVPRDRQIVRIKSDTNSASSAGEGSRNYVVFSPEIIEIIRKYGLAPPVAVTGLLAGLENPEDKGI